MSESEEALPVKEVREVTEVTGSVITQVSKNGREYQYNAFRDQDGKFLSRKQVVSLMGEAWEDMGLDCPPGVACIREGNVRWTGLVEPFVSVEPVLPVETASEVTDQLPESPEPAEQLIISETVIGFFSGGFRQGNSGSTSIKELVGRGVREIRDRLAPPAISEHESKTEKSSPDLRMLAAEWARADAEGDAPAVEQALEQIDQVLTGLGITDKKDVIDGLWLLAHDEDESWKQFRIEPEVAASSEADPPSNKEADVADEEDVNPERLLQLAKLWREAQAGEGTQESTSITLEFEDELLRQGVEDPRLRSIFMSTMLRLPDTPPTGDIAESPAHEPTAEERHFLQNRDALVGLMNEALAAQDSEQFNQSATQLWLLGYGAYRHELHNPALHELRELIWDANRSFLMTAQSNETSEPATPPVLDVVLPDGAFPLQTSGEQPADEQPRFSEPPLTDENVPVWVEPDTTTDQPAVVTGANDVVVAAGTLFNWADDTDFANTPADVEPITAEPAPPAASGHQADWEARDRFYRRRNKRRDKLALALAGTILSGLTFAAGYLVGLQKNDSDVDGRIELTADPHGPVQTTAESMPAETTPPPAPESTADSEGTKPDVVPPTTEEESVSTEPETTVEETVPAVPDSEPVVTEVPETVPEVAPETIPSPEPAPTLPPVEPAETTVAQVPEASVPVPEVSTPPVPDTDTSVPATPPPEAPAATPPPAPVVYVFTVEAPWQAGDPTPWSWAQGLGVPDNHIPAFLAEVMGSDWATQAERMQVGDTLLAFGDTVSKYSAALPASL